MTDRHVRVKDIPEIILRERGFAVSRMTVFRWRRRFRLGSLTEAAVLAWFDAMRARQDRLTEGRGGV